MTGPLAAVRQVLASKFLFVRLQRDASISREVLDITVQTARDEHDPEGSLQRVA
jgi:hypothetical protein